MVYITRRVARTQLAPTDPGYNPIEERRPQVLFSDWSPKISEPREQTVEVYSNCDEVELILNGQSLGKQARPDDDRARTWKVKFAAGVIKAVGFNGGKVAAIHELRSPGSVWKILLTTDKSTIANDWNDVAFVNAYVVDELGVVVPDAERLISFKIEGPGFIAAVDSANSNSHEPYQATERKSYQGVCLALIKANADKGKIKLTATSPELESASIELNVSPAKREN